MLRVLVFLLQHEQLILLLLIPLYDKNIKTKLCCCHRGVLKVNTGPPALHAKQLFMLLVQHGRHIFVIDLTPTVNMTLFSVG